MHTVKDVLASQDSVSSPGKIREEHALRQVIVDPTVEPGGEEAALAAAMPEGPWHFPADQLSDAPLRAAAAGL